MAQNRSDTEVITDIPRGAYHVLEISETVGLKSALASACTSIDQSIDCTGCVALPCTTFTNRAARYNIIIMDCGFFLVSVRLKTHKEQSQSYYENWSLLFHRPQSAAQDQKSRINRLCKWGFDANKMPHPPRLHDQIAGTVPLKTVD